MSLGLSNVKRSQMAEASNLRGNAQDLHQHTERTGLLPSIHKIHSYLPVSHELTN